MEQTTDADLCKRSIRGDTDAFAQLVKRYAPMVQAIALSGSGRADVAEDLAQEAFYKAYSHMSDLHNPASFRPWLWGITRRVCLDWLRKNPRRDEQQALPDVEPGADDDPAFAAEQNERRLSIRRAVDELPPKYRIVVQLRHLQEMPYEDIARLLELSTSGVSNRLAVAREMLRVKLKSLAHS